MRKGTIHRVSKETQIWLSLTIDGRGRYQVSTGIGFFDHMLELFAHHGGFDLKLKANGDLHVDQHHTVEDVGIVLGQAFDKALGSKRGILRAGYFLMPMDETMGMAAVDFCGRTAAVIDTKVTTRMIGDEEQMHALRRLASPYNVNAVALACLPEALADQTYIS